MHPERKAAIFRTSHALFLVTDLWDRVWTRIDSGSTRLAGSVSGLEFFRVTARELQSGLSSVRTLVGFDRLSAATRNVHRNDLEISMFNRQQKPIRSFLSAAAIFASCGFAIGVTQASNTDVLTASSAAISTTDGMIEHATTHELFLKPKRKETEMYVEGRYG